MEEKKYVCQTCKKSLLKSEVVWLVTANLCRDCFGRNKMTMKEAFGRL